MLATNILTLNILLFGCIVVILIISTVVLLTVVAILLKRSDSDQYRKYESLAKAFRDHDLTSGEKNSRQDGLSRESGDGGLKPESQAKYYRQQAPDSSSFRPGDGEHRPGGTEQVWRLES